jgi:hypothetical protein
MEERKANRAQKELDRKKDLGLKPARVDSGARLSARKKEKSNKGIKNESKNGDLDDLLK